MSIIPASLQSRVALGIMLGLALTACDDPVSLPSATDRPAASVAGTPAVTDQTPRPEQSLAAILVALADSSQSDGTLIVGLKEPGAARGVSIDGRLLPIVARYTAEAAILQAFPDARLVAPVRHVFTFAERRGLSGEMVTDTLHRTYVRLMVPPDSVFLAALRANPYVDFIEPNYWNGKVNADGRMAPTLYTVSAGTAAMEARPWAIDSVRADEAWALGWTGTRVGVRVVDSGIDWMTDGDWSRHPDIVADSGIMFYNPTAARSDNRCRNDWEPCYWEDEFHGTGVFGAAAAKQNGVGSIGVAPGTWWLATAKVTYVTTTGAHLLSAADFADAVLVVTDYHNEGHEIGITSVGFPGR